MENGSSANGHSNQKPGEGWSNGDLKPQMFPVTRDGKISLYSSQRRWISPMTSWTRIGGTGKTELDSRHSESLSGDNVNESPDEEARTIRSLIAQLCEKFYNNGWATGTGGGVSIRIPDQGNPDLWRVFVAPSGIQKEDMIGDDVFELDMDMNIIVPPKTPNLRLSACTPLWYVVYKNRPTAKSVIHTHSINAQMATLLDPTEQATSLKITHLEMLKGVGNHAYDDVLEIPIIDNRPTEDLLADQLESVINKYPKANAVLVRRHGLYVWGDSWEQAKTQCESFDYLFESAIKMKSMGIDPGFIPNVGTYRVDNSGDNNKKRSRGDDDDDVAKKKKAKNDWNASKDKDNSIDLQSNTIPLLPRDRKVLLLDIEGCTTSISFVKDILFPYVLEQIDNYLDHLEKSGGEGGDTLESTLEMLQNDVRKLDDSIENQSEAKSQLRDKLLQTSDVDATVKKELIKQIVVPLVHNDIKASGLKSMQGKMWSFGYKNGQLKGHVYSDFVPLCHWCKDNNVQINIYSSGSVQAQKLLFGHSISGDLTPYISNHFDISTSGNKKVKDSYVSISKSLGMNPSDIVFVSDSVDELIAARDAGIGHPIMSIRPGNEPLTNVGKEFSSIHSLLQLCGE